MKKADAIVKFNEWLSTSPEITGENIIKFAQEIVGMKAPSVQGELSNHLCNIYIEPDFNKWDEEVLSDPKVQQRRDEAVLRELNKRWRPT